MLHANHRRVNALWVRRAVLQSLGFALVLAGLSWSGKASAQAAATISVTAADVDRTQGLRKSTEQPYWVNRADCESDNDFIIPYVFANTGALRLEVWAGTADCGLAAERKATTGSCRQVATSNALGTGDGTINVTVKELVRAAYPDAADAANLCSSDKAATAQSITVYFLLLDSSSEDVSTLARFPSTEAINVDLVGPKPPTAIVAGAGEGRLLVKWTSSSETSDPTQGYQLYCEKIVGGTPGCTGSSLKAGEAPNTSILCGSNTGTAVTSGTAGDLENGAVYAVAVTGKDLAGNEGTLSEVVCGTPEAVTDFYESYRQAGGSAGGGFCSFSLQQSPKGVGLFAGALLIVAGLRRRQRTVCSSAWRQRLVGLGCLLVASTSVDSAQAAAGSTAFGSDGGVESKSHGISVGTKALYELRFGPYPPKIDDEFGDNGPYQLMYGKKKRLLVGFEADWLALQLERVGTLGPALGFGMTQMTAKSPLASGAGLSGEENTLSIVPMYGVGVLRVTALQDQLGIPLVPFAKAGVGYSLWWATSAGNLSRYNGSKGRGASYGTQWSAGLMLNLGFLDRAGEADLRTGPEFESAFLFGEWLSSNLDGFGGKKLNVGSDTWFIGLALRD